MFAIQRNDGKFFCNHYPSTGPGGFQPADKCVNIYIDMYPSYLNRRRNKLRQIYLRHKVRVVRLTQKQLEYLTFVKLRGMRY
jgi:hypothetical protein